MEKRLSKKETIVTRFHTTFLKFELMKRNSPKTYRRSIKNSTTTPAICNSKTANSAP